MCGIAGILYYERDRAVNADLVISMMESLKHRGPDDSGYHIDGNLALGFRRLSIIDLSPLGHQPMSNADETLWLVFNGEVYNFMDLRSELERSGYSFRSRSDAEVVVHAYERYGEEFVHHLRGMFGLALWDGKQRKLVLARDRVGKKPLYYYIDNEKFIFASEIKAILRIPEVSRDIDYVSLEEYFAFGFISGNKTIYKHIRQILPGNIATIVDGKFDEKAYWRLVLREPVAISEGAALEQLRGLLSEAVRIRLTSDVPLGAFLSGGIDSTAVVAMMAEQSGRPVKTFSVGFRDEAFDETTYARMVAQRFATDHTEEIIEPNYADLIDGILADFDQPFGDSSALPMYVVSRITRKHVTVALSGDGGDEVFGGYDLYIEALRERVFDRIPRFAKPLLKGLYNIYPDSVRGKNTVHRASLADHQQRYINRFKLISDQERGRLLTRDVLKRTHGSSSTDIMAKFFSKIPSRDLLTQLQYNNFHHYLPDDILVKVDRMSMLNSLETRSPLLDHKLIEFVFGLPHQLKIRHGTTKYLLKSLLRGMVPDEILTRPKKGFALPLQRWFRKELYDFARDCIFSEEIKQSGIVNLGYADRIMTLHRQGGRDRSNQIWVLLAFAIWCRKSKAVFAGG